MSKNIEAVESFYRQLAKIDPNMDVVADMLHSAALVSDELNGPKEVPADAPLKRGVRRLISNITTTRTEQTVAKAEQTPATRLEQLTAEYKRGTRTPELITNYWQERLIVDGGRIGLHIKVPPCDWTEGEISRPMVDIFGKKIRGLMLPDLDEITLPILGRMYPRLGNRTVQENSPVTETHTTRGWLKVYDSVEAPNLNATKSQIERFAEDNGYLPGREKGYILSDVAMWDFRGEHIDSGSTWSWLLGARIGDEVVYACVVPDGSLYAGWSLSDPEIPNRYYGFRLEEARKA